MNMHRLHISSDLTQPGASLIHVVKTGQGYHKSAQGVGCVLK